MKVGDWIRPFITNWWTISLTFSATPQIREDEAEKGPLTFEMGFLGGKDIYYSSPAGSTDYWVWTKKKEAFCPSTNLLSVEKKDMARPSVSKSMRIGRKKSPIRREGEYTPAPCQKGLVCFIYNEERHKAKKCPTNLGLPQEVEDGRKPRCSKCERVGQQGRHPVKNHCRKWRLTVSKTKPQNQGPNKVLNYWGSHQ